MSLANELRRAFEGELLEGEPLAPRTSVRAGGAAELFARPRSPADVAKLLAACRARSVPVAVLGGGANTIVADRGVRGVVVKLPVFAEEAEGDGAFVLGCGAPIARVPQLMKEHGLAGGEFLAGIPGTLGGAVAMNAGTKQGETERVVDAVELATEAGVAWVPRAALVFRYRACELPAGAVATRVRVRLRAVEGDELAASQAAMAADLAYRKRTQPLTLPNSGSVFTNPPGDFAGRLVEAAGLKGLRQGAAQISEKHANWIVNHGGARAADVRFLLDHARAEVRARFGVELHPEVKLVGDWSG